MIIELFSMLFNIDDGKWVWSIGILAIAMNGWGYDRHLFYIGYHNDSFHLDLFWVIIFCDNQMQGRR